MKKRYKSIKTIILVRIARFFAILLGSIAITVAVVNLIGLIPDAHDRKSVMPFDYRIMESIPILIYGLAFVFPYKCLKKKWFYHLFLACLIVITILTIFLSLLPFIDFYSQIPLKLLSVGIIMIVISNLIGFLWIMKK